MREPASCAAAARTRHASEHAAAVARAARSPPCLPPSHKHQQWPNRKAKIGAWVVGMMVTGVGLPCFAVWWQQSKLKG